MRTNIKILLAGGEINAFRLGTGKQLLIALHGFAQTGEDFVPISQIWGNDFTIYAIDLPFHGATQWKKPHFTTKDVQELISDILQKENSTTYHLLGFSLGGRIILSALEQLSASLQSITLIAPDGLATRRMLLPKLIPDFLKRSILENEKQASFIKKAARFLHTIKLLDKFSFRYVNYHFDNKKRRKRLLNIWLLLSFFQINQKKVAANLAKTPINISILISNQDKYISAKKILRFAKKIASIRVFEYEGRHHLNDKKMLEVLVTVK